MLHPEKWNSSFISVSLALLPVLVTPEETLAQDQAKESRLSAQEEAEFKEELRRWESQREGLFEELAAAVEAEDRIETYYVLKRLHGGGAGPDGSEFELRRAEVRSRKKLLAEMGKKRGIMARMAPSKDLDGMDSNSFDDRLASLEKRIARETAEIDRLEQEALNYAEKAIVAELPIVFELLSGGLIADETEVEDPFSPPDTN